MSGGGRESASVDNHSLHSGSDDSKPRLWTQGDVWVQTPNPDFLKYVEGKKGKTASASLLVIAFGTLVSFLNIKNKKTAVKQTITTK